MKIDIHTHILPENWPDLSQKYGYDGFIRLDHHKCNCARMMQGDKFFREIRSNCWDPLERIKELDLLSLRQVLIGFEGIAQTHVAPFQLRHRQSKAA